VYNVAFFRYVSPAGNGTRRRLPGAGCMIKQTLKFTLTTPPVCHFVRRSSAGPDRNTPET